MTTIYRSIAQHLASKWGYDVSTLLAMPYDFRLSPDRLESRDRYFSRLKRRCARPGLHAHPPTTLGALTHPRNRGAPSIELVVEQNDGLPALLVAHSLGGLVVNYFFAGLEARYPRAWRAWADKFVAAYFGLGIPLLGAPAALMGLLGGDTFGLPITLAQSKDMGVTFGSTAWLLPRPEFALSAAEVADWGAPTPVGAPPRVRASRSMRWPDPLLTLALPAGDVFNYTVEEVAAGKPFRDLHLRGGNAHAGLTAALVAAYAAADLPALHGAPPPRPPLRHVVMIYGAGRPTEGATRFAAGTGSASNVSTRVASVYTPGDGTVTAASLDWAQAWHTGPPVVTAEPSRVVEYYDHLLGRWGENTVLSLMNTVEPAYTVQRSRAAVGGARTTVLAVDQLEHRDTVKNPLTVRFLDDLFLEIAEEVLCREQSQPGAPAAAPLPRHDEL
jgi:hypothetical protein